MEFQSCLLFVESNSELLTCSMQAVYVECCRLKNMNIFRRPSLGISSGKMRDKEVFASCHVTQHAANKYLLFSLSHKSPSTKQFVHATLGVPNRSVRVKGLISTVVAPPWPSCMTQPYMISFGVKRPQRKIAKRDWGCEHKSWQFDVFFG